LRHTRKDFQIIIAFGHSAFITSQSIFVPTNMVLKRYLACGTFRKCQPHSNESCLSICTYTCKIEADNQLHNCVYGALSIKDGSVTNTVHLWNHCGEDWLGCSCSDDFTS